MSSRPYLTVPTATTELPPGVPYIVANEAAERFSFYGMRAILTIFMTSYLLGPDGQLAPMSDAEASKIYHRFVFGAYLFPLFGGLLADTLLGKYRTIILLSLVYCAGHLALALGETRVYLFTGLTLIAIGAGGIKPCVSAHVGDQFGRLNKHLLERVFGWFYIAINVGAFASTLLTPALLSYFAPTGYGPAIAFGLPGVLMLLATFVFWLGRHRFIHVPAGGMGFLRDVFTQEGAQLIARLGLIYVFVAFFWCLFDQTGSRWVLQAQQMDRTLLPYPFLPGWMQEIDAAQVQAANPALILMLVPLFTYVVYPAVGRIVHLTALRKVAAGMFLAALAFCISAWIEGRITAGEQPHIIWQFWAYVVLTAAEVMVSITCLEFSYTQARPKMKSLVMSLYFLSVAAGNLLASEVNARIESDRWVSEQLAGANYYWFFAALMFAAAVLFIPVALLYKERSYTQDEPDV